MEVAAAGIEASGQAAKGRGGPSAQRRRLRTTQGPPARACMCPLVQRLRCRRMFLSSSGASPTWAGECMHAIGIGWAWLSVGSGLGGPAGFHRRRKVGPRPVVKAGKTRAVRLPGWALSNHQSDPPPNHHSNPQKVVKRTARYSAR